MLAGFNRFAYAVWSFLFYLQPQDTARTAAWRAQDLAEMRDARQVDPDAVGDLIGAGMQHRIYEYQARTTVLKIATPIPFLRFPSYADAQRDVELLARFFEPYGVVPIQVIALRAGHHAILQRRLDSFHVLTPEAMNDGTLRAQFLDVVERNRQMRRSEGRSLDFLGREGQRKCRAALLGFDSMPTIANLVVETRGGTEQLRILDTDLENLYPQASSWREWRSGMAARLAVAINRFFIQRFFGIDIG